MWLHGVSSETMLTQDSVHAIGRKRGNPNWGKPIAPRPTLATEFEMQVRRLRLMPDTYLSSAELRTWCEENRNRRYIPEWLLDSWNMIVEPTFAAAT